MDGSTPKLTSALSALTLIRGAATRLDWGALYNPNASVVFLQLFDAVKTADVTLGTTAPTLSIPLPASSVLNLSDIKCRFLLGVCAAATTTATGSTAPGSAIVANLGLR